MEKFHFYNKGLQRFARQNRTYGTKAEASLWKFILKGKKLGYQFNRQRPILNYIADFMCVRLKLIIEVDGITHNSELAIKNDSIGKRDWRNTVIK
jgi:very-short-patch-repair endonuclease